MKTFRLIGLALVAMFAFFAIAASSALAEETLTFLLANWLINGLEFTGELEATQTGELDLNNTSNGAELVCSGLFDGILRESADFEVLKVLNLAGTEILELSGEAFLCTSKKTCEASLTDVEFWPLNLPWLFQIDLMEPGSMFVLLFSAVNAGVTPGYHVSCLVLGLKAEEECALPVGTSEGSEESLNVTGGIELMGEVTPLGSCGSGTGNAQQKAVAGNLLTPNEGGTLSVSSEG